MSVTIYKRIVFMQGTDAYEALQILDEQGEEAAIDFLAQWDYGDYGEAEEFNVPMSGEDDDVIENGHYRLSYNIRLRYIGLESYYVPAN